MKITTAKKNGMRDKGEEREAKRRKLHHHTETVHTLKNLNTEEFFAVLLFLDPVTITRIALLNRNYHDMIVYDEEYQISFWKAYYHNVFNEELLSCPQIACEDDDWRNAVLNRVRWAYKQFCMQRDNANLVKYTLEMSSKAAEFLGKDYTAPAFFYDFRFDVPIVKQQMFVHEVDFPLTQTDVCYFVKFSVASSAVAGHILDFSVRMKFIGRPAICRKEIGFYSRVIDNVLKEAKSLGKQTYETVLSLSIPVSCDIDVNLIPLRNIINHLGISTLQIHCKQDPDSRLIFASEQFTIELLFHSCLFSDKYSQEAAQEVLELVSNSEEDMVWNVSPPVLITDHYYDSETASYDIKLKENALVISGSGSCCTNLPLCLSSDNYFEVEALQTSRDLCISIGFSHRTHGQNACYIWKNLHHLVDPLYHAPPFEAELTGVHMRKYGPSQTSTIKVGDKFGAWLDVRSMKIFFFLNRVNLGCAYELDYYYDYQLLQNLSDYRFSIELERPFAVRLIHDALRPIEETSDEPNTYSNTSKTSWNCFTS